MRIIVDGDSCSKLSKINELATQMNVPVHIFCDYNHQISGGYAYIHEVECCKNSADFSIINFLQPNDIVITNDIGLATMVLAKNCSCMSNWGIIYTDHNIMSYCAHRHVVEYERRKRHRNTVKGENFGLSKGKHRSFKASLFYLIQTAKQKEDYCEQKRFVAH